MAIANFIPTVWSAKILENLHKAHVYAQDGVVNRDYEGDIADAGDTVKINSIGRPTIGTYSKDTNIGDPESLTGAQQVLTITEAKYFNFEVDDVDKRQQQPKVMGEALMEAAYGLADVSDLFVAALYPGVAAANIVGLGNDGAPITPTATTAYNYLVVGHQRLDEANVPKQNRWVVVPPWFYAMLLQDNRFINSQASGSTAALREGDVGTVLGMTVKQSNNVPNTAGTLYKVIFGYPGAITYAEQITKVEAYRPPQRFADAIKGLHLYGAKLVRPTGIAVGTFNPS